MREKTLQARIAEEARRLGEPRTIDPGDALLEEVARSAGHVDYLRRKCEDLEETELVWQQVQLQVTEQRGDGQAAGTFEQEVTTHRAEINRWWAMYSKEREHHVSVCTATLRAGVEERRVRIAERTAGAMSQVAEGIAKDLGFDPNDARVSAIIGARFRELLAAAPGGDSDETVAAAAVKRASDGSSAGRAARSGDVIDADPSPVDF